MSYQSERLEKLISYKKNSLAKIENKRVREIVEGEIIFLEKDVLPVIRRNSSLLHDNISKWANNAAEFASQNKYNGIMFFVPISSEYKDRPKIAIVNPNEMGNFRELGSVQIYINEIEIINMDGNKVKYKPNVVPISEAL